MIVIDDAHGTTLTTIVIDPILPMTTNTYFLLACNLRDATRNDQPKNWSGDFQTLVESYQLIPVLSLVQQDGKVAIGTLDSPTASYTTRRSSFIVDSGFYIFGAISLLGSFTSSSYYPNQLKTRQSLRKRLTNSLDLMADAPDMSQVVLPDMAGVVVP
ncbi:hypothetical protein EDD17DRAFT_1831764 [Pisolithus thermaeus]|nr:hypothetical protein EDD17DRAFT_1831764 [Pisolithus thermaeus]